MTHERRPDRLRVDIPTLEPDDAFVGRLAHLSAASRPVHPRSTRSAGLRMVIAGGSVAVIATAAWAAGVPTGWETPLSPADSPTQHAPAPAPGPGDAGTPHSDVPMSPGSPLSPGLPGAHASSTDDAKPSGPRSHAIGNGKTKNKGKKGHAPGGAKDDETRGPKNGNPGKGPNNAPNSSGNNNSNNGTQGNGASGPVVGGPAGDEDGDSGDDLLTESLLKGVEEPPHGKSDQKRDNDPSASNGTVN